MRTKNGAHASVALFTDYLIIFKTEKVSHAEEPVE